MAANTERQIEHVREISVLKERFKFHDQEIRVLKEAVEKMTGAVSQIRYILFALVIVLASSDKSVFAETLKEVLKKIV